MRENKTDVAFQSVKKHIAVFFLCFFIAGITEGNVNKNERSSYEKSVDFKTLKEEGFIELDSIFKHGTGDSLYLKTMQKLELLLQINPAANMGSFELLLGDYFFKAGDYSLSEKLYKKSFNSARKAKDFYRAGISLKKLATLSQHMNNNEKAINYLTSASNIFLAGNFHEEYALALYTLGNLYVAIENESDALSYYFKALLKFEALENTLFSGACLFNLSNIYTKLQDNERSLNYTIQALEKFLTINDTTNIAACYINIGNYYHIEQKQETALKFYKAALDIYITLEDDLNITTCLGNIGNMHYELDNIETALEYFNRAKDVALRTNNKSFLSRNEYNLSLIYIDIGDIERSKYHLQNCIAIAKEIPNKRYLSLAYRQLSVCDSIIGNYQGAYYNLYKYILYKDSLLNEEKSKQIVLTEAKFKNEISENQIKLLSLEKRQQEQSIAANKEKNRLMIIIFIAIFISLIFVVILFFIRIKTRQKEQLNREKDNMRNEQLKTIIQTQENERQRISSDLHDGIGQKLASLILKFEHMENDNFNNNSSHITKDISKLANECYLDVRTLSHQIMPKALYEAGIIMAIEDLLQKTFSNTSVNFHFHHNITKTIPENISLNLYRITQELLTNIIKHSGADEVNISIINRNGNLVVFVEDNGKGLPSTFDIKTNNGIGLQNINARLNLFHGTFTIENNSDTGVIITIRIPFDSPSQSHLNYEKTN